SPIVAIIGTGIGKSLIFILLALTSTSVTVVIIPILALKNNLKDCCIKARFNYIK
ncbi:hypothetical protein DE146DRAFT_619132, partial [Phaeosphaeria sp. MPI-PUGE-AT-0046c]